MVRSWLLDLIAAELSGNPRLDTIAPIVADSGEGRWTVAEAIDLDVPAPVITLSLIERLSSRDANSFSRRLLAAMRHQFGGHAIETLKKSAVRQSHDRRHSIDLAEAVAPDPRGSLRPADPCAIVIFGASGDLARRKLIPALYELASPTSVWRGALPSSVLRRTPMSDDAFRDEAAEAVRKHASEGAADEEQAARVSAIVQLRRRRLRRSPKHFRGSISAPRRNSTASTISKATVSTIWPLRRKSIRWSIEQLGGAHWRRAGTASPGRASSSKNRTARDLASARQLNRAVLEVFDESQVYRIDHYLGKDTVQNLLVLRFGNGIFEPLWNRNYVDHVQITAAEDAGRGNTRRVL